MNPAAFRGMTENAAFLLALVVLYVLLPPQFRPTRPGIRLISGVLLGTIATAVMLSPWQIAPGIFFDTRSILLAVAALFFDIVPAAIAGGIAVGVRLIQGGAGAWTGSAVVVSSVLIGIGWQRGRRGRTDRISWLEMYMFGLLVHAVMLLLMLTLPGGAGMNVIRQIAVPVMVVYPVVTVLLGQILARQDLRREAEEAVKQSAARLRQVVQQMPVMLVAYDAAGRVLAWNQEAQRITGYDAETVLGTSPAMEPLRAFLAPHDPPADDPTPSNGSRRARELVLASRDGSLHTIAWSDLSTQTPIPGWHRWAVGIDVTDLKRAEQELALSNERLQILRSIDQDIMGTRRTSEVVERILAHIATAFPCQHCIAAILSPREGPARFYSCDAAGALPFPRDSVDPDLFLGEVNDLPPGEMLEWHHFDTGGEDLSPLARVLAGAGVRSCLAVAVVSPEAPFGALAILSDQPLVFDAGHHQFLAEIADLLAIAIHGTDMAEELAQHREKLEIRVKERTAELQTAYQEMEAFSYSVSHDLRAPLRAIDGFSLILLEDHAAMLDDVARSHLQRARLAAQHMDGLIDDLLSLSRVSTVELFRTRVDMSALVDEIAAELRKDSGARRVELAVQPGIVREGDRDLLRILLDNLLRNAWKFTSHNEEAHVEFGVTRVDGEEVCYIRDDGAGFDMAYVSMLFGPFQRLHSTREFEGTGIGLAICRRIVQRHGGRIWAEGQPGKGATFYFALPAMHEARA